MVVRRMGATIYFVRKKLHLLCADSSPLKAAGYKLVPISVTTRCHPVLKRFSVSHRLYQFCTNLADRFFVGKRCGGV